MSRSFFAIPSAPTVRHARALLGAGLCLLALGCDGGEASLASGVEELATVQSALLIERTVSDGLSTNGLSTNGLLMNGLSTNGLSTNGLSTNGLSTNGLSTNGLAQGTFAAWFNGQPEAQAVAVMKYLVRCAVPAGQRRTWTNPETGASYTWEGSLGLAPVWASGLKPPVLEQQVITACMAAHVNKYGIHMPVSIRGRDARGVEIPLDVGEAEFTQREAAFFGNLFSGEGVFVCGDRAWLNPAESSARACGLASQGVGVSAECPPLEHVGLCASSCRMDPSRSYYVSCTRGGKEYRPLNTRIRKQDVYLCGDGVCQISESCDDSRVGVGNTYNRCLSDCGRCGTPDGESAKAGQGSPSKG